jgi:choline dehydrogenase-like flavoprotein
MYNLPTARNSTPRRFPGATSPPDGAPPWDGYQPRGAVGAPEIGQRCEGNSSCTPICPVQAKYSALKTLNRLDAARCTLWTQAVASWLELDANGRIARLHVKRYDAEGGPATDVTVEATLFVLAAHAVENAKILLASGPPNQRAGGLANSSGQVGRNLMDHPYFLTWALAPESMGSFRGPGYTSGVWSFMNGAFREHQAAFRIDIGNWGWNFATNSPYSDVLGLMQQNVFGSRLRTTLGDTVPRQIRFGFQLEQLPEWRNQVTIDDNYRDALGQYRPVITYGLSDYTWRAMASAVRVSHAMFDYLGVAPHERFHLGQTGSPTAGLPTAREFEGLGLAFYGAGHLVGTHRMGSCPAVCVVNAAQQSWDHDNLYVVGCGSQPTIGCANPTLTAAALALRSARDMLTRLR